MRMGSRTPVQSAQQHSETLALKELNGKTGSPLLVSVSSENNWNFVTWNFNFRAPRQWWNIPCLSSLMLNMIHRDFCNDQDSTVKTLPKDLNSSKFWLRWFIQTISSARTEFLHPVVIHCLVPPHWHAMAHLFPWWLRYQRYLEVWPSMAQLKWLWFWFGSLCGATASVDSAGASWFLQHLVMFRHVQTWIAASKISFRSRSAAKSKMYHHKFCVRPTLGLTWSIFAHNDTKLQPLPPTSKDTSGKRRNFKVNWHQLTNSEPKRSTDGLQKPGERFGESARHCLGGKLCGFFDYGVHLFGGCQELCVLQQVWMPGRFIGGLPTESPWKTSQNYCVTNKWTTGKPNILCKQILHRFIDLHSKISQTAYSKLVSQ